MFGLSWAEIGVIGLLAVIVIKPDDWPAVIRMVQRGVKKIKELSSELTDTFQDIAKEADFTEITDDIRKEVEVSTIIDLEGKEQIAYDLSDLEDIAPEVAKAHQKNKALEEKENVG